MSDVCIPDHDEAPDMFTCCADCSAELERVDCFWCDGDGAFHDCGEDTCPCADPEGDLNDQCAECGGRGWYRVCPFCAD